MPPAAAKRNAPVLQTILLTQKAEIKSVRIPLQEDGTLNLATLQAYTKKKEGLELLGSYKYKPYTIYLFGFLTGKAGTENKHELPPPHDTILCFGDILVLASKDSKRYSSPVPFTVEEYESFYTKLFEGFEDLDDEASEEELEEEAEAEEDEEDEEEEEEEEEAVPTAASAGAAAKKSVKPPRKRVAQVVAPDVFATNAAASYYGFVTVSPEEQLQQEGSQAPLVEPVAPHRVAILKSLNTLFMKPALSNTEMLELERAIYNGAVLEAERRHVTKVWSYKPFVNIYTMHARHIASNFHPDTYVENRELFERFRAGQITIEQLSSMDPYKLFNQRWSEHFTQQQVQEKRQLEGNKAMATDQFLCNRCRKRECTYYEMQTRSADEPMTIFITCLNCGKHWRQ
jgi:transcription elongation factor S-II